MASQTEAGSSEPGAAPKVGAATLVQPVVLMVEGKEDIHFFQAFVKHLGLHHVQVVEIGGKHNLRNKLAALKNTPGFSEVETLVIVRDADRDPNSAFQSVCDALRYVGLPVPTEPLQVAGDEKPRTAILILPNADKSGMLEDLCLQAVARDPAMFCVDQFFACLQERGMSLPDNLSKARVQVFLASRREPDLRLGEAAECGYWPWDAEAFGELQSFFRKIQPS